MFWPGLRLEAVSAEYLILFIEMTGLEPDEKMLSGEIEWV